MNLRDKLKARKAALIAEATALQLAAESAGGWNDDSRKRDDEISAELITVSADLERESNRLRTIPAVVETPIATAVHDRELDKPWGYQWQQAGADAKIVQHAGFGEKLLATRAAALGKGYDPRLSAEIQAAAQGAGEAIDADGGYLVGKDTAQEIMLTVTGGEVLSRVKPIPIGPNSNGLTLKMINETDRATGSRSGAVRGYWVDEGGSITASRPKFRQIELKLKKLAALGYASDELLQDYVAFGAIMTEAFGEELQFLAEDAIINGDGAGKPLGIVGHAATVSVAKETGQAAATVVKENIDKMWSRLWAKARGNAVWLINQNLEPSLNNLSMTIGVGGVPVYLPPGGLSETPYARLYGRPVVPIEYAASVGTVGDIILADLSKYAYITKGGIQTASSIHVAFATDEQAFRAIMRVDGQPKWETVLTPYKGTADTQSPIVTLATRA